VPTLLLAEIPVEGSVTVASVAGDPALRERLVELGFTPGQRVVVLSRGIAHGPVRVRLRGGSLGLRHDEARSVLVTPGVSGADAGQAAS
jgi:ferrous iron transport protein A